MITNSEFHRLENRVVNIEDILKTNNQSLNYAFQHEPGSLVAVKFENLSGFINYLQFLADHKVEHTGAGGTIVILLKSDYELTRDVINVAVKEMPVVRKRDYYKRLK